MSGIPGHRKCGRPPPPSVGGGGGGHWRGCEKRKEGKGGRIEGAEDGRWLECEGKGRECGRERGGGGRRNREGAWMGRVI